jgi:predicted DNA-binding transcriptional regulator AlpA
MKTDLMTAKEVASMVRVSMRTFDRWCRKGQGPREVRLSEAVRRYASEDVASWLIKQQREPA